MFIEDAKNNLVNTEYIVSIYKEVLSDAIFNVTADLVNGKSVVLISTVTKEDVEEAMGRIHEELAGM